MVKNDLSDSFIEVNPAEVKASDYSMKGFESFPILGWLKYQSRLGEGKRFDPSVFHGEAKAKSDFVDSYHAAFAVAATIGGLAYLLL